MAEHQITTATGTIHMSGVHDDTDCAGRPCIIHSPLVPTNIRNLQFRGDKGIFEEYCEHGIGHPTPEDRRFLQETNQEWRGVHGCDGCCAFIKATRELHVRLKDRDTWAEFYNDDRDIEVFLDALNKGHEVEQMSIGSGTTYILDNGLYLVEVMEEHEHPAVQRIVEWLTRGTPPDQTAVLVIAPTLQYMRSTIMRPLEKWPELAGADIVYIPYSDDVLMKAAGIHRRFLLVVVMGDPNENALLAAHLLTNNSNSEIAFYLHEA